MRRMNYLLGSALTVVISVAATVFVASLTAQAAPAAHDLPRIVTALPATSSAPAAVATTPSANATASASPTKTASPAKPKPSTAKPQANNSKADNDADDSDHSKSDGDSDDDEHETVKEHLHESDGNEHSGDSGSSHRGH